MKATVERVNKEVWKSLSEGSHENSFGTNRPKEIDRVDFALVSYVNDKPTGYVQCLEMDSHTLYWQTGGAFIDIQKTMEVVPCYMAMVEWSLKNYQRITTRVDSENIGMLHLAMKMGFRVRGTWHFDNHVYVELLNEREEHAGN